MFYAFVRAVVGFALRLFYRVEVNARSIPARGPLIFVGNHPNSLVDPALIFVITARPVTFLARDGLFRTPGIGQLLRGLGALPVYRKQDDPSQMGRNEGTFEAATQALVQGRAITLFPEGKSHSGPMLAELKTGAARIALRAAGRGAPPVIVPVGLTYEEKHRFRSRVLIEVGEPVQTSDFLPSEGEDEAAPVRALTERIEQDLRRVTLNLERWEDLPVIALAERLYAFRRGDRGRDPDRLRRFAAGLPLFRAEQPERFEALREEVVSFGTRLEVARANPQDLTLVYQREAVWRFVGKNLASVLLGFPLFAVGMVLFAVPYWLPRMLDRVVRVGADQRATLKVVSALVLAPLWLAVLAVVSWRLFGGAGLSATLAGCLPLALFTRYFLERKRRVLRDVQVFFVLGSRTKLKARLLVEGERLAAELEQLAAEYRERVGEPRATRDAG